eukprot:TRINITY_DN6768_c0_g1_i1.p1 TRINITY_DN6768_c0_g1~~TRINITY_DN6768_c0_g1_i1.p1  ORF type:complete len:890 (+),score=187.58 TRINITY_DN6768_c0_g1_i1:78-2747(+)
MSAEKKVSAVSYFPNSSSQSEQQFILALNLGIESIANEKVNLVKLTDSDEVKFAYFTDFTGSTTLFHMLDDSTVFSVKEIGEDLANFTLETLKALDWSIVGLVSERNPEFDLFHTTLRENSSDSILVTQDFIIDTKYILVQPVESMFELSKVIVLFGDITFIQKILQRADFRSFGNFSGNNLVIVTHSCKPLSFTQSGCDAECLKNITPTLARSLCIDRTNQDEEDWINSVWPGAESGTYVDYRVSEMYDNGKWLAKASVEANNTPIPAGLSFEEHLSQIIDGVEFEGLTKSNPPVPTFLSLNEIRFEGAFERVLETNQCIVNRGFLESELTVFGSDNKGIPKDYTEFDYDLSNTVCFFELVVFTVCLLCLLAKLITQKKRVFKFGILSRVDGIYLITISIILMICRMLTIVDFYNCFIEDVLMPAFRICIVVHIMVCHYGFMSLILNRSWKNAYRIPETIKLSMSGIIMLLAIIYSIVVNLIGGYDYGETLFSIPDKPTVMMPLCNSSVYTKASSYRWLSSVLSLVRSVSVTVTLIMCIRLVISGMNLKGFGKRCNGMKARSVTMASVVVMHIFLFISWVGTGSCYGEEKRECGSVSDGLTFLWGGTVFEILFIIVTVLHSIHLEMEFKNVSASISKSRAGGIHTFVQMQDSKHKQATIDRKWKFQNIFMSNSMRMLCDPASRASRILGESLTSNSTGDASTLLCAQTLAKMISSSTSGMSIGTHVDHLRSELGNMHNVMSVMGPRRKLEEVHRISDSLRGWLQIYLLKERHVRIIMKNLEAAVLKNDVLLVRLRRQVRRIGSQVFSLNVCETSADPNAPTDPNNGTLLQACNNLGPSPVNMVSLANSLAGKKRSSSGHDNPRKEQYLACITEENENEVTEDIPDSNT